MEALSAARIRGLGPEVLSRRALNRATLARQLLLARSPLAPLEAVERLVGLQAQEPLNPYTALWSRLEGFRPEALAALLEERRAVRIALMRSTIHLVSGDDCLVLRPLMQPVLDAELARHGEFAPRLRGVDLDAVLAFARVELGKAPLSGTELRARWRPVSGARRSRTGVRVPEPPCARPGPPRGLWGRTSQVRSTTVEAWLGRPLATQPSLDAVVLRYFAAFGPAAVADVATWSRLTGLREVVERLRPQLGRSETSAAASSSTCRTRLGLSPPLRRRRGFCRSTTTSCSPTTIEVASSTRTSARASPACAGGSRAPC